jgi:DNA-binding transcriptional MerR regulator
LRIKRPYAEAFAMELRIGEIAELTGASVPTIRYYEEIGVMPRARRQTGGQRVYSRSDVERLTFVLRCRELDFSIEEIRELVALLDDRSSSCMDARQLAAGRLGIVKAKMRELKSLERNLKKFVASCDESCVGGPGPDCVVLTDLAKPCGCGANRRA